MFTEEPSPVTVQQRAGHRPEPQVDATGWPRRVDRIGPSYKATLHHLRDLAESAHRAAAALPNPREKHALPFAALALLHLRYRHGFPRPSMYEDGADVVELQRVCDEAGIVVSSSRLRKALTDAFKQFDAHYCPYHIEDLLV